MQDVHRHLSGFGIRGTAGVVSGKLLIYRLHDQDANHQVCVVIGAGAIVVFTVVLHQVALVKVVVYHSIAKVPGIGGAAEKKGRETLIRSGLKQALDWKLAHNKDPIPFRPISPLSPLSSELLQCAAARSMCSPSDLCRESLLLLPLLLPLLLKLPFVCVFIRIITKALFFRRHFMNSFLGQTFLPQLAKINRPRCAEEITITNGTTTTVMGPSKEQQQQHPDMRVEGDGEDWM